MRTNLRSISLCCFKRLSIVYQNQNKKAAAHKNQLKISNAFCYISRSYFKTGHTVVLVRLFRLLIILELVLIRSSCIYQVSGYISALLEFGCLVKSRGQFCNSFA